MNPETLLVLAREKASRGANVVRFRDHNLRYDTDEPRGPLASIMNEGWDEWIVYPSGLAVQAPRVNWLWVVYNWRGRNKRSYDHTPRIGTAEQAFRFLKASADDLTYVEAASPEQIHGTCVRFDNPKLGTYELVQARAFPHWVGR